MVHSKAKKALFLLEKQTGKKQFSFRRRINRSILHGGGAGGYQVLLTDIQNKLNKTSQQFTEKDFNSPDGFQTPVWGPLVWNFLHIISLNYTPEKKQEYQNFITALQNILPCVHCRTNFTNNSARAVEVLKALPKGSLSTGGIPYQIESDNDVYKSRTHFARYIWQLHHEVSTMLGKDTTNEPSFEKMRNDFETFRSRCLTEEEIKVRKVEAGCTASVYGADAKAKCKIAYVPRVGDGNKKVKDIDIHPRCKITKSK